MYIAIPRDHELHFASHTTHNPHESSYLFFLFQSMIDKHSRARGSIATGFMNLIRFFRLHGNCFESVYTRRSSCIYYNFVLLSTKFIIPVVNGLRVSPSQSLGEKIT
jgi:hypothetical protein